MTKEMFEEITRWQKEIFTSATDITALAHLQEEVREVKEAVFLEVNEMLVAEEYADCFMLLFGSAALHGLSYEDICNVIKRKFEVNKQRKWGKPNEDGYVKHVKD
jgi:phosphoribosyl-ATP pyrophosphohydrolase